MRNYLLIPFFICSSLGLGQVKVGDNINTIDASSILELESSDKVFVITRMTRAQMNAVIPLNGALVYNTDDKCLFVFEGAIWKTLCNTPIEVVSATTAPTSPLPGDIWLNTTNSTVTIWDGLSWVLFPKSTWNGSGLPSAATVPAPKVGDIYVDNSTGNIFTYDGSTWLDQTTSAANGITKAPNNTMELGGTLTKATEINTDTGNTLALNGLEEIADNTNAVVTVDATTGVLRKSPFSAIVQQEEVVIIANDNQTQFNPPLTIDNSKKLNVYRNGVKLGFTVVDPNTIELETSVFCYQNDEIRIVQFY